MNMGTPEILIIALVVVLLFGSSKLPQAARSLGQSARVFKAEARGLQEDQQGSESSAGGDSAGTRQRDGSSSAPAAASAHHTERNSTN
jgi:sec-independent protein translocase protein TatA